MKFYIPIERHAQATEILGTVRGRLQFSPDYCASCIQERKHPSPHILYAEQWKSEEAIYEHIRSRLYRRVLAVMELSSQTPEVSFYFVSHTRGMELIEALRLGPKKNVKAT